MCAKSTESDLSYQKLLEGNKEFIEKTLDKDPHFFENLAKQQKPPILWIGCADSRVPANQITNTAPGDVFVHRNIANMVVHSDMNMLSVLDYAVNVLEVKHVIVTGHYGCGGVRAAMGNEQYGLIDNWLRHIKDVYRLNADKLDAIKDETERFNRFVELNVRENVYNLCRTSIIQNAWARGMNLGVHGWVYGIETGKIDDLNLSAYSNEDMEQVFSSK
jgi:carbonic anhydrase